MSDDWDQLLDPRRAVVLHVRMTRERRTVTNYAVVLTVIVDGVVQTVRVYDGAHGVNDLHRHTRTGGKQLAETFHDGTLGEGMRAAIVACIDGYDEMIRAWDR